MKKAIWTLVLLGAAYLGYSRFTSWRAYKTFESFAESWARETRSAATKFADDATIRHAFEESRCGGRRAAR